MMSKIIDEIFMRAIGACANLESKSHFVNYKARLVKNKLRVLRTKVLDFIDPI